MSGLPETDDSSPDLNPAELARFKKASILEIKKVLRGFYESSRRDPMSLFRTLSKMLGRATTVSRNHHVQMAYTTLDNATLCLYVPSDISDADIERYKGAIDRVIKPELVQLARKLDRAAQDQVLEAVRNSLYDLEEARAKLTGAEFDPVDERLLAVAGDSDITKVANFSGDWVRLLLNDVFKE